MISKDASTKQYLNDHDGLGLELSDKGRKLLDFPLGTFQCLSDEIGKGVYLLIAILVAAIPNVWRLWHILFK